MPCIGDFAGELEFDGGVLMMLAKGKVPGDTVELRYEHCFIQVGPAKVEAVLHRFQADREGLVVPDPTSPGYVVTYTPPARYRGNLRLF